MCAIKKCLTHTFVSSTEPLFPDNDGDSMCESLEPRLGRPLVVDELDLDSLHRGDDEDGLRDAGPEAAQQPRTGSQGPLLVGHALPERLERPEADGRLGDGAVQEDGEATVEAAHSTLTDRLLGTVDNSLKWKGPRF